jgi:hypothetical protein
MCALIWATQGCAAIVGANFDVHPRESEDAGDARLEDAGAESFDRLENMPDASDRNTPQHDARADAEDASPDDADASGPPVSLDGGSKILLGGFVASGAPGQRLGAIEMTGHLVSQPTITGTTAGGITIEGRFQ